MRVLEGKHERKIQPEIHRCTNCSAVCEITAEDWHTPQNTQVSRHDLNKIAAGRWWRCPECGTDVCWTQQLHSFREKAAQ